MAPMLNIQPATPAKGTTRKNKRFWVMDIHTQEGELKVYGCRHQPSPKHWWSEAETKPSETTPSSLGGRRAARRTHGMIPSSPPSALTKTKRKASDSADTCRQPALKRARTASLPAPQPRAQPASSRARTRSQTQAVLPTEPVPLAAHTIALPPSHRVPRELQHIVPAFGTCGSQRCGHHARPQGAPKRLACRDCAQTRPFGAMHVLSCGHALCRGCLNASAATTRARLHDRGVWHQVQAFRDRHDAETMLGTSSMTAAAAAGVLATPSPIALSPSPHGTAPPIALTASFAGALQLLNLWCCGMDTGMSAFQDCMEPGNAAANWLVDQLLVDPECYPLDELAARAGDAYNRCAWQDCQALLPSACRFERRFTYYYCVQCSGVSFSREYGINRPSRS